MPHLHTGPGGHDVTASAVILREFDGAWKVLVHRHKTTGLVLQPGGHVEHDENVWQGLVHELAEETGYGIGQLAVLQAFTAPAVPGDVNHVLPAPLTVTVHETQVAGHYHCDLVYGFVTAAEPVGEVGEGESPDVFWLTPGELDAEPNGTVFLRGFVRAVVGQLGQLQRVPADRYALDRPPACADTYPAGGAR